MKTSEQGFQDRHTNKFAAFVFRYAWWIVGFYVLAGIWGFFYTSQNLGVNSDTSEMFDEDLSFRKTREQYKEAFPLNEDNFVIVVEGETPELVRSTADSISRDLKAQPTFFEDVYQPVGEEFINKNQLLFLDSAELLQLTENLEKAKPLMTFLLKNYNLKGLFSFLGLMIRFSSKDQVQNMNAIFSRIDTTINATLEGRPYIMSWQQITGDQPSMVDTRYHFIMVKPRLDFGRLLPAKPAIEEAKNILASYRSSGLNLRVTGKMAMTYEEMGSVTKGAVQASLLALVMVSLTLWIGLRSFRLIAATLITLVVGLMLTAAFSTWAVGRLNMISIAFAVLYIGLGVDYAIHVCLRYRELHREQHGTNDAIRRSLKDIGPALFLSTLSTAIGFYAFVPTSFAGVSELGLIAGTGMFISFLVTVTLLPSLLKIFSFPTLARGPEETPELVSAQTTTIERLRLPIRLASVLLALVAVWFLKDIKFDYDPINLRDPKSESVATIRELMATQSFTPWTLNVLAEDSAQSQEYVQQLKQLPSVDKAITIYNFIPKDQPAKLQIIKQLKAVFDQLPSIPFEYTEVEPQDQIARIEAFHQSMNSNTLEQIPALANLQATLQQLLDTLNRLDLPQKTLLLQNLQEGILKTLPITLAQLAAGLQPDSITFIKLPGYLKNRWVRSDGAIRIQVFPQQNVQTNADLRVFAGQVQEVAPEATGDLMVTIASGDTVVMAFREAVIYAMAAIALLLLVYLRNLKEVLFILLPLLLAGVFTGALTVFLHIDFNFANIIAVPLLLGLGVDNGVHIVHRAKSNINSPRSLLQTSTARAILFSVLTTLFSFGNLAFSPHRGTASMGLLLTFGVLTVLLTTLVILPAYLPRKFNEEKPESSGK